MPGSNPLFGLNTLGGALAIQTKNGATAPGTSVQAIYGSDVRRSIEFEHGGRKPGGLNWYLAGNLFKEDGWREESPSDVRQLFGKLGWHQSANEFFVTVGHAPKHPAISETMSPVVNLRFIGCLHAPRYSRLYDLYVESLLDNLIFETPFDHSASGFTCVVRRRTIA